MGYNKNTDEETPMFEKIDPVALLALLLGILL